MTLKEIPAEAPLTRFLYSKASRERIPLSGTFELSPVCNFACKMCYVRKTASEVLDSPRSIMTLERWLTLAKEAREQGMLYLLLTGGEPFLWPDFWELYEKLYYMGFLISINTNGSLIDARAIDRLRKMPPTRINITLYGISNETYYELCQVNNVYDRVTDAILGLKEAGINVKLNCSLTKQNACDLEHFVSFSTEQGLILDTTAYMYPPIRRDASMIGKNDRFTPREAAYNSLKRYRLQHGERQYQGFLRQILSENSEPIGLQESCIDPMDGKILCRAGKASFWATWDGYITPCGMMTEPKIPIESDSFPIVWTKLVKYSERLTLSGVCDKCPDHKLCHACAAIALAETGSTSGIPTYLCQMVLAMKEFAQNELI